MTWRNRGLSVVVALFALLCGRLAAPGWGEPIRWFRDGAITPRSDDWETYELLLDHPEMRAAFAGMGFDPDSTSRRASPLDLGNALYIAMQRARPAERDWFLRADELLLWFSLRGDCLHARWGLPDALEEAERADLLLILRAVIPGLEKLEFPPCTGGVVK